MHWEKTLKYTWFARLKLKTIIDNTLETTHIKFEYVLILIAICGPLIVVMNINHNVEWVLIIFDVKIF